MAGFSEIAGGEAALRGAVGVPGVTLSLGPVAPIGSIVLVVMVATPPDEDVPGVLGGVPSTAGTARGFSVLTVVGAAPARRDRTS